jgi:proline iminopeptidase
VPGLYPAIEPYDRGMLDVGDGNLVYFEVSGNPDGKPALVVHGGPGSGSNPRSRRYFNPQRYRIVLFDQRGCGRSTPHASDRGIDMRANTTQHLIADIERLRVRLELERWLLFGGSWGSTLLLAYAERHPGHVSEIVISGVTTTSAAEIDWLYGGVRRFLPEAWERFRADLPETSTSLELVAAYARRMEDPDPAVREETAAAWVAWEDAVIAHEEGGNPGAYSARVGRDRVAFVRICTHFFSHRAWLEDGELLRGARSLAAIPGVLVHGRLDLSSPVFTAWELARAWPGARLVLVDAGHTGGEVTTSELVAALDAFVNP